MQEETFLNEAGVQVTNDRFVVPGQTYALSGVTSVAMHVRKPKRIGPILLFIIGFFCLMGGFSGSTGAFIAALVFIGLGILLWISNPTKYVVRLMTASGESDALPSKDAGLVKRIVEALNNAIIHRG
jgi:predicted histidine transporter YuiF (NhaC family)